MASKQRKNSAAIPMGIITIILAVIGLITVIIGVKNFVVKKLDDTEEKAKYEQMLRPVVMFDPDTFDDLTDAEPTQLLYAAIWSLLEDEKGMSNYSYYQGETIGIQVPQEDIEKAFINLFGNEIDIASMHSQIDMSTYDISYDSALKAYILPITGVDAAYLPKVYSIDKQGSSVILNVGYIGYKAWADISGDQYSAPEPDKYMKITLRERSGGMYISSIQTADSQEIASQITTIVPTIETIQYIETTTVEYEELTDENGEAVTDENGEKITVPVTSSSEESTDELADIDSSVSDTQGTE